MRVVMRLANAARHLPGRAESPHRPGGHRPLARRPVARSRRVGRDDRSDGRL